MNKCILSVIESISNEKSISKNEIFETLENALDIAIKKKYEQDIEIKTRINKNNGYIAIFRRWKIVNTVTKPLKEITYKKAKLENPKSCLDSYLEKKINSIEFNRITMQIVKQTIVQKIQEVERLNILKNFQHQKGSIIKGVVKRITRKQISLDIGYNIKTIINRNHMICRENFRIGDKTKGILYLISNTFNVPKLFISRSIPEMLIALFKIEVPEINQNIIEIKAVVRKPGVRSKIAVKTNDKRIDPIGACIGLRGSRVQAISNELSGEKTDIILWDKNPKNFVINAMAPAHVSYIVLDKKKNSMNLFIKKKNLAKAIGKYGQNIRLASEISGWKLNILVNKILD